MPNKASVAPVLEQRVRDLIAHASDEATARRAGTQVTWFRPDGFVTDPYDTQSLETAFDRSVPNGQYAEAVDPDDAGTVADLVATVGMVDHLAIMQRAFRARHTASRPRMMAQQIARKQGHGSDQGVFGQLVLEYIRNVLRRGNSQ